MDFAELVANILKAAGERPIIALVFGGFLALTLLLGMMHEGEIFGEVLVLLVRRFKHQVHALMRIARKLKLELTTWKEEPEPRDTPNHSISSTR